MEIESFYGVYLLYNENPQFKGRTYIGYTVNPNRRIRQHNVGKHAGGAKRTHGKGPWAMALIVHGFPNDISALRFEWAWQNPDKSRILKSLTIKKTRKENAFEYRFRVLCQMLRTGPWCRLALTIRWLLQDYQLDFPSSFPPPDHMAIAYGPVKCVKVKNKSSDKIARTEDVPTTKNGTSIEPDGDCSGVLFDKCDVCKFTATSHETMKCYQPACHMTAHVRCLARLFLKDELDEVIPLRGICPCCGAMLLWGELVRHKQGCYMNPAQELHKRHWSEDLMNLSSDDS